MAFPYLEVIIFLLFASSFLPHENPLLHAEAFNIDTRRPQIHRRIDSGFGYSLDFAYRTSRRDKLTLIVGAPFAQSSSQRSSLRTPGAVYGCEVDQNICSEIFFDRQGGNELRLNGSALLPIEEKSFGMFGATVVASKNGDSVLACAPHYKYFFSKFEVVEPVGTCYYAQNYFDKIDEFAPCRQEPARHGHHRFGYGMCGFSAAVPDSGDRRLFISAPGVWYWQGAVFSQNVNNVTDRPNTADGPAHTDHHQLGYSTAAGDFDGDGKDDIVVGVPRGNELIGMVSIYTETLKPIANLTIDAASGGQRGQYFGASVAVADLNRDGRADLIVGSPFYTDYKSVLDAKTQERKPQYDIGKVYVYIQTASGSFKEPVHLVGHTQWGRFGHAVAAAGDLNGDGFEDFIVGAPYDGDDGHGAVYVYHGAEDGGVREEPTQRIQAKDVNRELKTFGFAIAGGKDIDKNEYPDIAVGSLASSQAVLLKTKPVMKASMPRFQMCPDQTKFRKSTAIAIDALNTLYNTDSSVVGHVRTKRKTINLGEKMCVTEFGRMPCEKLSVCLKYAGKLQPEFNTAELRVKIHLDSRKGVLGSPPRAFMSRKDLDKKRGARVDPSSSSKEQPDKIEHTIQLTKGREHCENYDVYVPDTIRDKISPIVISVNYTYVERGSARGGLEPAVDTTLPQSFEAELTVEKDCGEDNICVPDLQITTVPTKDKLTVGTLGAQSLTLNVTVRNQGEDSYLTQYYVTIPPEFEYGGIENYETKHKVSCLPVGAAADATGKTKGKGVKRPAGGGASDEPYTFVCDIGNPLPAGEKAEFGFKITASQLDTSKDYVEVQMGANSTIAEEAGNERDNQLTLRIPIEINAQLNLIGRSNPEQIDFSVANRTEGLGATFDFEVGPVVSHLYQVINRGPSAIQSATLDIVWPSYQMNGRHLLYLIDMPFVSDGSKASCRVNQGENVNPASLAISNQHVPTPGAPELPLGAKEMTGGANNGESGEDEEGEEEGQGEEDEFEYRHKRNVISPLPRIQKLEEELRQAVEEAPEGTGEHYTGFLSRRTINCHDLKCTHIQCDINRLEKDDFVLVEIFSRLWVNTLIEEEQFFPNTVSSLALAQITSMPHGPRFTPPQLIVSVTTHINPIDDRPKSIGWWWWLLAILIALLILTLVIYCCYKCGFFKRNRPHMEKARLQHGTAAGQPGGGGGYYADDSARYAHPQMYSEARHGARV